MSFIDNYKQQWACEAEVTKTRFKFHWTSPKFGGENVAVTGLLKDPYNTKKVFVNRKLSNDEVLEERTKFISAITFMNEI